MRWVFIFCLLTFAVATAQTGCRVSEFYGIAWSTHNPTERHEKLLYWLQVSGERCTQEQLIVIWNALPEWAGTADSVAMRQKIMWLYDRLSSKGSK
jgi:hypothetical protein